MLNKIDIFKNTNNQPDRSKSEWRFNEKLKCSFELQLGLGGNIYWPPTNPVSLLHVIQLLNRISSWPREDIQLKVQHFRNGDIVFETYNETNKIDITSNGQKVYTGIIPHSGIKELKLTILKLLDECQKSLRNKYAEILFNAHELKIENNRFLYGDKVSTVLSQKTKTPKKGLIRSIIQKSTGTKYLLLVNGIADQREYLFEEIELIE